MAQGRRQAREPGGPPRAVGRHGGGGRPRRGARGFATLGRGAARVGGAGPAVGGGDAAAEARRGAGADAQGRGSVLRGDRRATGLDLYKGKSLQLRRAGAASCGCTRSSRREPSANASRRSSRRWRPGRCRARRCSSSGRTSATAPACRATVRQLHASRLRRATAWLPLGALVEPARAWVERIRGPRAEEAVDLRPMEQAEKVDEAFRRLNAGEAAVQPVAPSVAEAAGRMSSVRINVRSWVEVALQRLQSSDLAMTVHATSSGGGGRIGAVAALIGVCVSGVGAGTYCVATALLPDPKPAIRAEAKPASKPKKAAKAKRDAQLSRLPSPASQAVAPTPTPARRSSTRTAEGATEAPEPRASPDLARPGEHPGLLVRAAAADPGPVTPAAAPSTGGGEFEP